MARMHRGTRGAPRTRSDPVPPDRPSPRTIATFVAFALVGMLATALPPYPHQLRASLTVSAVAVLLVALLAEWLAVRRRRRTWVDPVGAWLLFACIALLRAASGGSGSALAPLLLVPLLWLALFGTRRDLYVGAALTAVTFVGPVVLIGPPTYQPGDLRRALLWSALVLLVLPVVQQVVRQLVVSRDRAERLFVDAPHGIAVLDADGRVRVANPALCALLGTKAEEVAGRALASFGETQDRTVEQHVSAVLGGRRHRSEADWAVRRSDGELVHMSLSSTVLEAADGDDVSVLVHAVDTTQLHRHHEQLAHLADHDPLTGLANRRRFAAELSRHLDFCARYGARGALILLDLDHFKDVNDTLGHSAGDELIVSVAGLLRRSVRSTDLVARLGGDEFAILLMEGDRRATEAVAEKVVGTIRDVVTTLDGAQRHVTASAGVVMVEDHDRGPSDLLAAADMTMYDAKEAGRDQWQLLDYDVDDRPRTGAHIEWTSRLTRALDDGGFVLHLQPICDIRAGRVSGAEVLLRIRDGDALVYPDRFLYIAERSQLVNRIDEWVLRRSIALLSDLQREDPGFHLAVNLSGRSIGHEQLEHALRAALDEYDVDPAGLVLEITETAAVADVQTARAFAERVTALGCRFALDDFGAGFGSFYYLKHLLFDYVKIDGEFVAHCHASPTDRAIVNSIVGIAHGLGKKAVAEYVSEPAILDVVREEGVDLAQGYHIGRPIAAEQFRDEYLRGSRTS